MKGFYQYLAPFAPDYSGACSVLYAAGGMIVICDPGGCSGVYCGYDEPRFYGGKTPLYSAALREMDVVLGRDDRLVQKISNAAAKETVSFVALVAGPVVSVIGTDLPAVAKLLTQNTGLPALAVPTTGMDLYDSGEEKAYAALLARFLPEKAKPAAADTTLLLGVTPLELPGKLSLAQLTALAKTEFGESTVLCGGSDTLRILRNPLCIKQTAVVSPAGLAAAKKLQQLYGIPYRIWFPDNSVFHQILFSLRNEKKPAVRILLLHQQFVCNALRKKLQKEFPTAKIAAGSFFKIEKTLQQPGDLHFAGEDEFTDYIRRGNFDVIVGDPFYQRALGSFTGTFLSLPQVAVSGEFYL